MSEPQIDRVLPHDHEIPWALQIAVVRDKTSLAREIDVCEAGAEAVVRLLDDDRSAPGGDWHDDVEFWKDAAIRKLVRRASGKRWHDVQALPGVTVERTFEDAPPVAVRAFVPAPVHPLPRELNKLQVEGTQFTEDGDSSAASAFVHIEVSPLITMTSGKKIAQCAHAAQIAYETMDAADRDTWRARGFAVRVDHVDEDAWAAHARPVSIVDAGFTELDGPTETTRAFWG